MAETTMRLGDVERASAIHTRLLPYADRVAVGGPEIALGSVARHLGLAAFAA
jgi:hypothetical protein